MNIPCVPVQSTKMQRNAMCHALFLVTAIRMPIGHPIPSRVARASKARQVKNRSN